MPDAPARLWIRQAESDLAAANWARGPEGGEQVAACHAAAKYQQAVEKAVKGIVAALKETGIISQGPTYSHGLERELAVLKRLPLKPKSRDIASQVKRFLDAEMRGGIMTVADLAPRRAGPGELARKNPEYPYQQPDGAWIAPTHPSAFGTEELVRYQEVAKRVCYWAGMIVAVVERAPR